MFLLEEQWTVRLQVNQLCPHRLRTLFQQRFKLLIKKIPPQLDLLIEITPVGVLDEHVQRLLLRIQVRANIGDYVRMCANILQYRCFFEGILPLFRCQKAQLDLFGYKEFALGNRNPTARKVVRLRAANVR